MTKGGMGLEGRDEIGREVWDVRDRKGGKGGIGRMGRE